MKKQLFSLLLALVLVLGLTVISAAATEEPTTPAHADHCVCGGQAVEVGDHVCETATGWTPFSINQMEATSNANQLNVPAGNYYLAEDITINKELNILPGTEVTFCMNGHKLTGTRRIFRVNGPLNLCDCSADQSGVIDGKSANGPVFYGYNGGDIRLFGGTLTSTYTGEKNWGGVCALAVDAGNAANPGSSQMTMYGGTIDASDLNLVMKDGGHGNGGALVMMGTTKEVDRESTALPTSFTMYGGAIYGAESVENCGAAIYCNSIDVMNLLGGTITGGSAGNYGSCVAYGGGATVVVGGNVNIEELCVNEGKTFTTQNLTGSVGLATHISNTAVMTTVTEAEIACFTSKMPETRTLVTTETADGWAVSFANNHIAHCICGGVGTIGDHTCTVVENWIGLTAENIGSYLTASDTADGGNASYTMFADDYDEACFYLEEDIALTTPIEIHTGDSITLCLNGYTLKKTGDSQLLRVWGTLNICDCTGEGAITSNANSEGGLMYLLNTKGTATVNIFGGTLQMTDTSYYNKAGLVQVGNNGTYNATLNIYGGTIANGKGHNGGNIYIERNTSTKGTSVVNMYGGTVKNGTAKKYVSSDGATTKGAGAGGNIYVAGYSELYIYGGTIEGGSAVNGGGGNIYTGGTSKLIMTGGVIKDGVSQVSNGGNICAYSGSNLSLTNATITGGSAGALGGNIHMGDGAEVVITDSVITNGTAVKQGGNICINQNKANYPNAKCYIIGSTVTGGKNTGDTVDSYGADIGSCATGSGFDFMIDGKVTIGEIGLNGQAGDSYALGLGEKFATDAPIKIDAKYTEDAKGKVIKNISEDLMANFVASDPTLALYYEGDSVYLHSIYYFCRCGGNVSADVLTASQHTCDAMTYTPVDQAWFDDLAATGEIANDTLVKGDCVVLPAGNYVLVGDVTITKPILIKKDTTVNLNLFSHTITSNTGDAKYGIVARGGFRISDSNYDAADPNAQWGKLIGSGKIAGSALYVCGTSTTFFFGGEICASVETSTAGGPLAISGTFHQENGIIRGYKTTGDGGAINVFDNGSYTLWEGTVIGGEARYGGAICGANRSGYNCSVTIWGGTVTGGKATQYGGNIYVQQNFKMSGGVVENGESLSQSHSGGNICISGANATISGGTVTGGKAKEGGNISIRSGGKLTVSGGVIENGYAYNHGGNIAAFYTLNITGGEIRNGAAKRGGNISTYANAGKITISGGKIVNGILYAVDEKDAEGNATPDGIPDTVAAQMYGANISMNAAQEGKVLYLTVTGGEIGGFGEGCVEGVSSVHIASSGEDVVTTVGGTAVIDQICLGTGRMITVAEGGFQEGASVGVERFEISGVFAPEAAEDYSDYFVATDANTSIQAQQTETGYNMILVSSVPYYAFSAKNYMVGYANTIAEAMAIEGAAFVRLVADHTSTEVVDGDVYIDLSGNQLFSLTVNGNLYLMDSKGNEFTEEELGGFYGTANVVPYFTNSEEYINNTNSYYVAEDELGMFRSHRVEVVLTHVSLKANDDALGFRAEVHGDSTVLAAITGYGFNMNLENHFVKTYKLEGAPVDGVFTLRLTGIMANNGGELDIFGQPFVCFGEDTANGNTYTTSMKDTILAVNKMTTLTETQKAAVYELYAANKDVIDTWFGTATNNIAAWAPVAEPEPEPEPSEPEVTEPETTEPETV